METSQTTRKDRFNAVEAIDSVVVLILGTAWLAGKIKGIVLDPINIGVGIATLVAGVLLLAYDCRIVSLHWSRLGWILLSMVLVVALFANM